MERNILQTVIGRRTTDGAGVHLTRVLDQKTTADFDPFLMLDSFDSRNPADYIRGFPWHPHRGIETITYLIEGEIQHEDSLGNKGRISAGGSQWMTAGSGILHQEMPQPAERMLGIQLWLNMPQKEKMVHPAYFDITPNMIPQIRKDFGTVRIISGPYENAYGVEPAHVQATIYDISLDAGKGTVIETKPDETVFIFLIEHNALINGSLRDEKNAVLFGKGDTIRIRASMNDFSRFLFFSGKALLEPIAWGGPIVMNTRRELEEAFDEIDRGTFIKHNAAI